MTTTQRPAFRPGQIIEAQIGPSGWTKGTYMGPAGQSFPKGTVIVRVPEYGPMPAHPDKVRAIPVKTLPVGTRVRHSRGALGTVLAFTTLDTRRGAHTTTARVQWDGSRPGTLPISELYPLADLHAEA